VCRVHRGRAPAGAIVLGGLGLFHLVTALMFVASAVLVHAFVTGDFGIGRPAASRRRSAPLLQALASCWGGLDGSLMFW
jgi:cytochrome c biogenesis factor